MTHEEAMKFYVTDPIGHMFYRHDRIVIEAVNAGAMPNPTKFPLPLPIPTFEEWKRLNPAPCESPV